jgi:hypothetical protein
LRNGWYLEAPAVTLQWRFSALSNLRTILTSKACDRQQGRILAIISPWAKFVILWSGAQSVSWEGRVVQTVYRKRPLTSSKVPYRDHKRDPQMNPTLSQPTPFHNHTYLLLGYFYYDFHVTSFFFPNNIFFSVWIPKICIFLAASVLAHLILHSVEYKLWSRCTISSMQDTFCFSDQMILLSTYFSHPLSSSSFTLREDRLRAIRKATKTRRQRRISYGNSLSSSVFSYAFQERWQTTTASNGVVSSSSYATVPSIHLTSKKVCS